MHKCQEPKENNKHNNIKHTRIEKKTKHKSEKCSD